MRIRAVLVSLGAALSVSACGYSAPGSGSGSPGAAGAQRANSGQAALPSAHPQAVEPVAGNVPTTQPSATPAGPSVTPSGSVAQPVTDAEVRAQLAASGMNASPTTATLTPDRLALAPIAAPSAVQALINAGNQIAHLPYIWGGGHQTYQDTGYDCSGSLSFVLAAAGLLNTTMTSGELESWGKPGPGRWITVFAAPGHTFMYVAGLRFDTVALAETGSRWSNRPADEPDRNRFVARHPPGL